MSNVPSIIGHNVKPDLTSLQQFLSTVCPVNQNAPVTMSKKTFTSMCKVHVKRSLGLKTEAHFNKVTNYSPCARCAIRESVAKGNKFSPPKGVTLQNLEKEYKDGQQKSN